MAPNQPARRSQAARLFGYDVFVSFALGPAPRGSRAYASDLARKLRERDFTVFFSEDEAPAGGELDETLKRALHRSRTLVVIANRGTLREPRWVRAEVEEFRRRHPGRAIVPVSIDGALQDPELAEAVDAWLGHRGRIWIDETREAGDTGSASDAVVERLVTAPRAVRSALLWRRVVAATVVFFAVLAGFSGWMGWRAQRAAQAEARAADSARAAERSASQSAQREAEAASAARESARREADAASAARAAQAEAQQERDEAQRQRAEAERQRAEAVAQGRRALAGRLVAEGRQQQGRKPDLALLLVLQAREIAATQEVDDTLLSLLSSHARLVAYLHPQVREPRQLAFGLDGRWLAVLGSGQLQLWDTEAIAPAGPVVAAEAHQVAVGTEPSLVFGLAYQLGHRLLAMDGRTGRALAPPVALDAAGEAEPRRLALPDPDEPGTLALERADDSVEAWELVDGQLRRRPTASLTPAWLARARAVLAARAPARSLDGRWQIDANGQSGEAALIGPVPGRTDPVRQPLIGHERGVPAAAIDPTARLAATAGREGEVLLWRLQGSVLSRWRARPPFAVSRVAFAQDGRLFVSASNSAWLVYDDMGRPLFVRPPTPGDTLTGRPAMAAQGDVVAERQSFNTVQLRRASDGEPIGSPWVGPRGWVPSLIQFSPAGDLVAAGGQDQDLVLWDRRRGTLVAQGIKGHSGGYLHGLITFAFGPDGKWLASGGRDAKVLFWDARDGRPLGEAITGLPGAVEALAVSPDGRRLAVSGEVDRVALVDLATRTILPRRLSATNVGVVRQLAFSPRSDLLAGVGQQLTVWRVATGDPLLELRQGIVGAAFDPTGSRLAVADSEGYVEVHDLDPAALARRACAVVRRNLGCDEWARHVGDLPYHASCPDWPAPARCPAVAEPAQALGRAPRVLR